MKSSLKYLFTQNVKNKLVEQSPGPTKWCSSTPVQNNTAIKLSLLCQLLENPCTFTVLMMKSTKFVLKHFSTAQKLLCWKEHVA